MKIKIRQRGIILSALAFALTLPVFPQSAPGRVSLAGGANPDIFLPGFAIEAEYALRASDRLTVPLLCGFEAARHPALTPYTLYYATLGAGITGREGRLGIVFRCQPLVFEATAGTGAAPFSEGRVSLSARLDWRWFSIGPFGLGISPELGLRFVVPGFAGFFPAPELLLNLPLRVSYSTK